MQFDVSEFRGRVLPALRDWCADGDLAPWWSSALRLANRRGPDPADRAVWSALTMDPHDRNLLTNGDRGLPLIDQPLREDTRDAVEVAVITATVGDGLAFGNAVWLSLDLLDEDDPVLNPAPAGQSAIATRIRQLDENLLHVNGGSGGYGEGLRGMLGAAGTAALEEELTAHGSQPVAGSVQAIQGAGQLQDSRMTLSALHSMARMARSRGHGLLHGRDLNLNHLGTWRAGVFHRRCQGG